MQPFLNLLVKVGMRMAAAVGVLFVSDLVFMVLPRRHVRTIWKNQMKRLAKNWAEQKSDAGR